MNSLLWKIVLLGLFCMSSRLSAQLVYRVKSDVTGVPSPNGADWANAFPSLADALSIAQEGDTIWVASGMYRTTTTTDRSVSFVLKPGVVMLGGFAGHEQWSDDRNPSLNETILSGEIGSADTKQDNSFHVVYAVGTDSSTWIDGFTLQDGYADVTGSLQSAEDVFGGGILIHTTVAYPSNTLKVSNCRIIDNFARNGGGVYCHLGARPIIRDCSFERNEARLYGGGLYKTGYSSSGSPWLIEDCNFSQNISAAVGGGICLFDVGAVTEVRNCSFERDSAIGGGGGIGLFSAQDSNFLLVTDCVLSQNFGQGDAGIFVIYIGADPSDVIGLVVKGSSFIENQSPNAAGGAIGLDFADCRGYVSIEQTSFQGNRAAGGYGAGIYLQNYSRAYSELYVDRCFFYDNDCPSTTGGGIWIRNGVGSPPKRNYSRITNTVFAKNSGAIAYIHSNTGAIDAVIANCTFYDNGIDPVAKTWAPVSSDSVFCKVAMQNCIFEENVQDIQDMLFNGSFQNEHIYGYSLENCLISAVDCNVEGGDEACLGGNVFNQDPGFLDVFNNNFSLISCSPAIDAGSNEVIDSLPSSFDLAGLERVQGAHIDIGAYERFHYEVAVDTILSGLCPKEASIVFAANGNTPYSEVWYNDLESGEGTSDLSGGVYVFSITDGYGCTDTLTVNIPGPQSITYVLGSTPETAPGGNGALYLEGITGGTPPYSIEWSTGDTSLIIDGLSSGSYELVITDSNGCTVSDTANIEFITKTFDVVRTSIEVSLYPNPCQQDAVALLSLRGEPRSRNLTILLLDGYGRVLWEREIADFYAYRNIPIAPSLHLASGVYWVQVFDGLVPCTIEGLRIVD